MAELSCCGVFSRGLSWKCNFNTFSSARTGASCGSHSIGYYVEVQKQPLEELCPNSAGWENKVLPSYPQLQRSPMPWSESGPNGVFIDRMNCTPLEQCDTREVLESNNAAPVDSLPVPLPDEQQIGLQGPSFARSREPGDDIELLCAEGKLDKALDVLSSIDRQGDTPSVAEYRCVLKACASKKDLFQAQRACAHWAKHGLLKSTRFLGEYLVMALVKCRGLEDALQVFDMLPDKTVFSWTAMISGYSTAGQGHKALTMYNCMREEGLQPDKYTFVSLLKACGSIPDLEEGKRIHSEALKYSVCSAGPSRGGFSIV